MNIARSGRINGDAHRQFTQLVDTSRHTVSPLVFSDPDIYRVEQEAVFQHSWLYIAHERQFPEVGSFVTTFMGEDGVIAWKDKDESVRVYLNSCPHRGMRLCSLDQGVAKNIMCPFHAWTFDLQGRLIGIPFLTQGYHNELRKEEWGLIRVPRVESYRGLIFASFDPDIESLSDYLGDAKWHLDMVLNRSAHGTMLLPGAYKWSFPANWKLISENLAGDNAHVEVTHRSLVQLAGGDLEFRGADPGDRSFLTRTRNGHGFIVVHTDDDMLISPELRQYRQQVKQQSANRFTPAQAQLSDAIRIGTIFPNFSYLESFGWSTLRVHHPRGPLRTETWSWMLIDADMPQEIVAEVRDSYIRQMAPPGIIETDDAEMWTKSHECHRAPYRSRFPLNYQMGAGHGATDPNRPGTIHAPPTEIGQFGIYQHWLTLMQDAET